MFYLSNWKLDSILANNTQLIYISLKILNNIHLNFFHFSSILCDFPWHFQSPQNSLTFPWLQNAFSFFHVFRVGTLTKAFPYRRSNYADLVPTKMIADQWNKETWTSIFATFLKVCLYTGHQNSFHPTPINQIYSFLETKKRSACLFEVHVELLKVLKIFYRFKKKTIYFHNTQNM